MKIVFTGGGTGGHFYPIIAIAQEIRNIVKEQKLLEPKLYYIAPNPYDKRALYENGIKFKKSSAGKMRRYFSIWNLIDIFKTSWGVVKTVFQIFTIYPDVVFSKGGYASFPTVLAAKLFRIPVIIHESDAAPGRVNLWAGKFARKIAISYPEATNYFDKEKTAYTGNPVRKELYEVAHEGAHEFLKLEKDIPTILILGGSQGAKKINNTVMEALTKLVEKYQIIHQTGKNNLEEVKAAARIILEDTEFGHRYKAFGFLNVLAMRMSAGAADLVVSRGGAGSIFEIAGWEVPSIIIPISDSNEDHQRRNSFAYARAGAGIVIEEKNLTPNLFVSEINHVLANKELQRKMKNGAKNFAKPNAARKIAEGIIATALKHEE
ncbi:MAG: undecaprenyldiphospho-muramoylpentapeptide beta-N-acetylglucosaminyltransferase [Candidatus Pacebacteria bacterium]|mgnify:CR=1 FL=1|jgi:UDP-N-acetylglucosamine--N-acetylmuramyl-(pentapeptide) pyrophosphoryl-undecaprenol N-acetylglucosamine transferase|nr:undecaprenyldiphospho-muramoylpentapeptide beta-N-acetylglucosaminyltransferase [Candidatus Paceibacterota bacterium]|tara:strand:+ start:1714 stop:2844 length:1131 start_codon:yes stop_codon:yes gene_type:complete